MKSLLLLFSLLLITGTGLNAALPQLESHSVQHENMEFSSSFIILNSDLTQADIDDHTILHASQPLENPFRNTIYTQDTMLYWVVAFELFFSLIVFVKLGLDYLRSKQPYIPMVKLT